VIGEQDISIKALLDYLNKSSWIKGAAIIGDAKAVIMVNTLDVIKEIGQ
jgi:chemotaxis protein histidine kinase CheA